MRYLWAVLGVAVVGAAGYIAFQSAGQASVSPKVVEVPTMPAGITFYYVNPGVASGSGVMGVSKGELALADADSKTLYTSDSDGDGKTACTGDCLKTWKPLAAPADAKSSGFWQVVARDDGSKQWALRGKPLYTYAGDSKPGDAKGTAVDSWHFVLNQAMYGVPLPDGITTEEMVNAGGQGFVDAHGKTLYAFSGDLKSDAPACAAGQTCVNPWSPLLAAALANPLGDFTVISRPDGTKQWAHLGRPLYTYAGDGERGEANGRSIDPRWTVALAERYFQPANVRTALNVRGLDMLVDANGMTVYARDRFLYQVGGFSLKGGQRGYPAMGKAMGALTCPADCAKTWPPVVAPDDAIPAGYWGVVKRPDGTKQWSYQGYALYTYTGDKKPGDETGHDSFDLSLAKYLPPTPSPIDAVSALYWREVTP
jgi:predicted lipoprotein with Yx(FWY)xxD motif